MAGELIDLAAIRAARDRHEEDKLDQDVAEYMRFVRAWREAYPVVQFIFSTADIDGTGEITDVQLDDEAG